MKFSFSSTLQDAEGKVLPDLVFTGLVDKRIDDSHKWSQSATLYDNSNRAATFHTRHVASQIGHIVRVMRDNSTHKYSPPELVSG